MYGRGGLDRFKKAQSSEPFSVNSNTKSAAQPTFKEPTHVPSASTGQGYESFKQNQGLQNQNPTQKNLAQDSVPNQPLTPIGGGQSDWQPPDWAIEPRRGVYYLDVVKEGEVLDKINLDKRRHVFGRQFHTCDFVLDHQSVSRQHAAVVPHKNGSIYVIDLGSVHGTFVANERLMKDSPVELEVGQSLRFAASTRTYILRKNEAALLPPPPSNIDLPPPPDPSDEEAVLAYNTYVNRTLNGLKRTEEPSNGSLEVKKDGPPTERARKRIRRTKVAFKDQFGGELIEVVGYSDGADVETEPGPIGVKEGSLVGKYESLVQITVIPKGKEKEQSSVRETITSKSGVTDKLKEVLEKVKAPPKPVGGIYDDLYGGSLSANVGSSWAYSKGREEEPPSEFKGNDSNDKMEKSQSSAADNDDDSDDLFG